MVRTLSRDPLLYARAFALAAAGVFIAAGGAVILPFALVTLGLVAVAGGLVFRERLRRAEAVPISGLPVPAVVLDLLGAGTWMAATAMNPRAVAFVLVLAVGTLAVYRLGRLGVLFTLATYTGARLIQELLRTGLGEPTPAA